ncbi:MAG: glycosyltransferase, partial [Lachnospiraceae bacterium]|nr:glycosyltransferase [Lachnospiraceae bacterium]
MLEVEENLREKGVRVKVSVIIPVYNVGNYLDRCLKSVLEQTEKNIEILC